MEYQSFEWNTSLTDWQRIVEENSDLVWKTVLRILNNHADASDCFQEVFLAALELNKKSKVRNWSAILVRISTNKALDKIRSRYRRREFCEEPNSDNVFLCKDDPIEAIHFKELADKLVDALSNLPRKEAEIFCMKNVNNMSYDEIAKCMKMRTNNVGVILTRAKSKLRKILNDVNPGLNYE